MVEIFWDISTLEGEGSTLSPNVGIGLSFDAATYSRRTKFKFYVVIVSFAEIMSVRCILWHKPRRETY